MKKLLMCSVESPEVNEDSLIEESQITIKDVCPVLHRSESINIKNFNYDVIVHFVSQGKWRCRIEIVGRGIFHIRESEYFSNISLSRNIYTELSLELTSTFVSAWEIVNKEIQSGRPVCYYSS